MIKSFVLLCALVASLTACGGGNSPVEHVKTETVSDLSGSWVTVKGAEPQMVATIVADTILVNWDNKEDSSSALYWTGTLPASKIVVNNTTLTSVGDTEKMSLALLASSSASKDFIYKNKKIGVEFTMLGMTQTLFFERV